MNFIKPSEIDSALVYERTCDVWHMRIYRAKDGTSIINRLRGAKPTKPAVWTTDRTPEEWVGIQRDPSKYNIIH